MDCEAAEQSRERAASSEPCSSTRPNPFEEEDKSTSRKRQRTSRAGSRSCSADATRVSDISMTPPRDSAEMPTDPPSPPPSTPPPQTPENLPAEPTSSRVTINLRTAQPLETIPSSPPSPTIPSKMLHDGTDIRNGMSVESESDVLSTVPADTPSSSHSPSGSPRIELVISEDEDEFGSGSPPVAIIGNDEVSYDQDPAYTLPLLQEGESLVMGSKRLGSFIQLDPLVNDKVFLELNEWFDNCFEYADRSHESWYAYYCRHRDFWLAFPEVVWSLTYRSRYFGECYSDNRQGRTSLSDFLVQFARLTARFVAMDVRTFAQRKSDNEEELGLASRLYLHAFCYLLRKHETPHIGKNLELHYHWDWSTDILKLVSQFRNSGGSLSNLTNLVKGEVSQLSRNPKAIIESLLDPCRIARKLIDDAVATLEEPSMSRQHEESLKKLVQGHEFFKAMAAGLELIIEKHYTFLSPDAACQVIEALCAIYRQTLAKDNDATRSLSQSGLAEDAQLSPRLLPKVRSSEWKFTILKKLICSTQMQLRVVGVTRMCADLLEIYNNSKILDPPSNPLLLYFAKFVMKHQLVDYLVGIGSHPEIISESNNIVGFLIVTKTYTYEQTDKIWQTVISSQDPRVVEAVLRMLIRILNLMDYHTLIYLCEKAQSLPIESLTMAAREYCLQLCSEVAQKAHNDHEVSLDRAPYDLCVKIIRQAAIVTLECPAGYPEVQTIFAQQFRELLKSGPSPQARKAIYGSCIDDVKTQTRTAPGSICVMYALVCQSSSDLHKLTAEHGLTELVVENLRSTITGGQLSSHPSFRNNAFSEAQHGLLLLIIVHEPDTISPHLATQLWDVLVGKNSKSVVNRNTSWGILNRAVKQASTRNVFIASCLNDYLPKLPPDCLTTGALEFAEAAVNSWLKEVHSEPVIEAASFASPPLEQIWRMIVTAPPNTIDASAINFLVGVYLKSDPIESMPRSQVRSVHLTLVDRCLRELALAAAKLKIFNGVSQNVDDDAMALVTSEDEFSEQEKIFARSLAVLREFLKVYQSKPQFATPKPKIAIESVQNRVEGEAFEVKYQSFDGNMQTEVKSLTVGKLNNANSLMASLQKATGFTSFKVYCNGKVFDPDDSMIAKSLDDLNLSGLLLVQRREDVEGHGQVRSSLELEITKHFEELWSYLAMHETVAQEIYYFLVKFPVNDRVLEEITSEETPYSQIFPAGQPFKSLFAIHALREYTATQSQTGTFKDESLTRAIILVIAAISDSNVINQCPSAEWRHILALHFMDCFVQLLNLKETAIPPAASSFFDEGLLRRLLEILADAKSEASTPNTIFLTNRTFEAILDASTQNRAAWTRFKVHLNNSSLLRDLLLGDHRPSIRKNVMKQIVNRSSFSSRLAEVSTTDFAVALWPVVADLVLEAAKQTQRCEEVLMVGHHLFKKLAETSIASFDLDELIGQWGELILAHTPDEIVGYSDIPDPVTFGLAQLLHCAASFAKASQQTLSASNIGRDLLHKLLFPELTHKATMRVPVLHTLTRHFISETIWFLVKDDLHSYQQTLLYLASLVPYEVNLLDDVPYAYDLPFLFERSKAIRSPTGYIGLKNLSNTCYLNSLFTQLFMNISFREFMLTANVAESGSQKLLSETQNLFSQMQNSFARFVNPALLAGSIQTYDSTPIDVSIQMDVDEFYNLLFDRWEGQILSPEAKKRFRSFYGGQLVQQVKSKECSHISERLEPFSAIQCDIKGKSCLQESLQAYVDGEIMEGENKYKCSECDRHVDAVKRACLKDVPDNLIFHLKRFDFNLRTLTRSKINDHFSFPTKLDMRPYKVEYLSDSLEDCSEDIFELVGVLVHSGTAESGHYYSYIRERPSNESKEQWVEFNDDLVSTWDPSCLENACFGGYEVRTTLDNSNVQFDKIHSAYMLFYQRSSVLALQKQSLGIKDSPSPVRLEVPSSYAQHIGQANELLMRRYCLYDPSHAAFVTKMLGNMKVINRGVCSSEHTLEKLALTTALNHMDQVFSRTKDLPEFPTFMLTLRQLCHSCAECSRDFLDWFCDCPEALRQQLLRNPDGLVRAEIASSILSALNKVKGEAAYAYGFSEDDGSEDDAEDDANPPRVIHRLINGLLKLWDVFEKNIRAWPEYFGLLASIAGMGPNEAALLLDTGFLQKSLEIVCADPQLPMSPQYMRMNNIINKRLPNRPVSYEGVILLLWKLLEACDPNTDSALDEDQRLETSLAGGQIPVTYTERTFLIQHWTKHHRNILADKLLRINQNISATQFIIGRLLQMPEGLDPDISNAIEYGIRKATVNAPAAPFLRAAIFYCEQSDSLRAIKKMLTHAIDGIDGTDSLEGREYLQFFKEIYDLPTSTNAFSDELHKIFMEHVHAWAPELLCYYDGVIRQEVEYFLAEIILEQPASVSAEAEEAEKARQTIAAARQLGVSCLLYLDSTYLKRRVQAVRATVLNIQRVIDACEGFFDSDDEDEVTHRYFSLRHSVLPRMKLSLVDEAEEDISDWDESGDEYGSSEPMELGDGDVQL